MRRLGLLAIVVASALICAQTAEATPITGNVSVTMNFLPNCGSNTVDCSTLGTATAIDFIASLGSTPTPGVAGVETVTNATGDFVGIVGGLIKDFTFNGAPTANFPAPTVLAWETLGGITFDLLTVHIAFQDGTALLLQGTGLFHMAGRDDSFGTFTLSGNASGTTFSASASEGVPDSGSTLILLGVSFLALFTLRRRFA